MDEGSDYDDADQGDGDYEGGNDDHRYDSGAKMRNTSRGGSRGFPSGGKNRTMAKGGARDKGDRYGGGEPVKSSGRMSITFTRRDGGGGAGKQRGRGSEHDRMRERERGSREHKGGVGRERDGMKGDNFMPMGRGKEKDSDAGGSRGKRRDGGSYATGGDSDDKLGGGGAYRERVDRSSNKLGGGVASKKVWHCCLGLKPSWTEQYRVEGMLIETRVMLFHE